MLFESANLLIVTALKKKTLLCELKCLQQHPRIAYSHRRYSIPLRLPVCGSIDTDRNQKQLRNHKMNICFK